MSAVTSQSATDAFRVEPWLHRLSGIVARHPRVWIRLGNLESRLLADDLDEVALTAPIYVAGLARSGSTLLLEVLARHADVACHRYRDFPMLFTPYAWRRFLDRVPQHRREPTERAHQDGMAVTPDSPEAFEEMLWMAFFPDQHNPRTSAVIDATARHPAFEEFYCAHLRKLLLAERRSRYLSKENYNLPRLQYLQRLFPDARFVVPVRDPVWHIASLMKQHRLFCDGQRAHPEALTHVQRAGHFEFGLDRRPINVGDGDEVARIEALWRDGAEIEGWARYWSHIHHFLADRLEAVPALREATSVVRFEALCDAPADVLRDLFAHCRLDVDDDTLAREAAAVRFPAYYQRDFTAAEVETIRRLTDAAASRLGVGPNEGATAVGQR